MRNDVQTIIYDTLKITHMMTPNIFHLRGRVLHVNWGITFHISLLSHFRTVLYVNLKNHIDTFFACCSILSNKLPIFNLLLHHHIFNCCMFYYLILPLCKFAILYSFVHTCCASLFVTLKKIHYKTKYFQINNL